MLLQALEIVRIGILFPFFSIAYIAAPHSVIGQTMRKPFIKFICHSASYFTFLCKYIDCCVRYDKNAKTFELDISRLATPKAAKRFIPKWMQKR